jgi:hypothetical protein
MANWAPEGRLHEDVAVRYPVVDNDPHFRRVVSNL